MPPGLTIPSIFVAVDRFTAPMMRMSGAMGSFVNRAEIGLARVERGFRRATMPLMNFQNILRGLGMYVGIFSLILLFRNAINVMADFEQAQINIASVIEKRDIPSLKGLSTEARRVAVMYGQSAAAISNFQFELVKMGFSAREAMAMTEPITTGGVALRTTPERLQEVVGAILKSHDMPVIDPLTGRNNAQRVVNQFAYVANATAAQFEDLATMLPIVNRLTHKMNISFPQALATLGQLRNVQVHTSTGATSFKNILLDLKATSWEDLKKGVLKILAARNQTAYAFDKFGKRSVISAIEIASMFDYIEALAKQTDNVSDVYTNLLAGKQLDSIRGRINLFKASYRELILSIDDGRGPIGTALKQYLDVASAVLLLSSDSDAARSRLAMMDQTIIDLANKWITWAKVIGWVIAGLMAAKALLITWNILVGISKVALFTWNVMLGVSRALIWGNALALKGNVVALAAYRVAVTIARTATMLFNAVISGTPLGLAILGIGTLIYALTRTSDSYDKVTQSARSMNAEIAKMRSVSVPEEKPWMRRGLIPLPESSGIRQWFDRLNEMDFKGESMVGNWFRGMLMPDLKPSIPDLSADSIPMRELFDVNSLRDEDLMRKLKLIEDRNLSIDINNKSGFPVSAKGQGATINMKNESTFEDF